MFWLDDGHGSPDVGKTVRGTNKSLSEESVQDIGNLVFGGNFLFFHPE
jgi:hypothetical protein